jgi:rod shape-determining protein MreB and related proteins
METTANHGVATALNLRATEVIEPPTAQDGPAVVSEAAEVSKTTAIVEAGGKAPWTWLPWKKGFWADLYIDLGTEEVKVVGRWNPEAVMKVPSYVTIDTYTRAIMAYGRDAKRNWGKHMDGSETVRVMAKGVVQDATLCGALLERIWQDYCRLHAVPAKDKARRLRVMVGIPTDSEQPRELTYKNTVLAVKTGLRVNGMGAKVFVVDEVVAAMLGIGVDPDSRDVAILDIGGGSTNLAVLANLKHAYGGRRNFTVAGRDFDGAIVTRIDKLLHHPISDTQAEQLKIKYAIAWLKEGDPRGFTDVPIIGRSAEEDGTPSSVTRRDIFDALDPCLDTLTRGYKRALDRIGDRMREAIFEKGTYLTGHGALIEELDTRFKQDTRMDVLVAEKPDECTIRGMVCAGRSKQIFKRIVLREDAG